MESKDVAFRRYASDAAVLRLVIDIIAEFASACGCKGEMVATFSEQANAAVTAILRRNLETTSQQKPSLRFLQAVWAIKDSSSNTVVAKDEDAFIADEKAFLGFWEDNFLWLNFEKVWNLVFAHYRQQGRDWLPSQLTVKDSLLREGFSVGKLAGAGKPGNEYVVRAKKGSRRRMLVLKVDKVEEALKKLD